MSNITTPRKATTKRKPVARRGVPILVKVARTGSTVAEIALNGNTGYAVENALQAGGLDFGDDEKLRVNGKPATLKTILKNGNVVTIAGNIQGAN